MLNPTESYYKKALKDCNQGIELWTSVNSIPYGINYQISNMGRIRRNNKISAPRILKSKHFKYSDIIRLEYRRKLARFNISTLIAKSFIPRKRNQKYLRYINNDFHDDKLSNIKWEYQLRDINKYIHENKHSLYKKALEATVNHKEIWRPLNNYSQIYDISSYGRIRSWLTHSHSLKILSKEPHLIKSHINNSGYYLTNLKARTKDCSKHCLNHRAVAITFIPNPHKYTQVDHINGNRKDNCVKNLRWCTSTQNNNYLKHINSDKINGHHRMIELIYKNSASLGTKGSIRHIAHWLQKHSKLAHEQSFTTVLGRVEEVCNKNCFKRSIYGFKIKRHDVLPIRTKRCVCLIKGNFKKVFKSTRPASIFLKSHTPTKSKLRSIESAISSVARGNFKKYYGFKVQYLSHKATNKFMILSDQKRLKSRYGNKYIILRRFRRSKRSKGMICLVIKNNSTNDIFLLSEAAALSKKRRNLCAGIFTHATPVILKRYSISKEFRTITNAARFMKHICPKTSIHGLQNELRVCATRNQDTGNHFYKYPFKDVHTTHGFYVKFLENMPKRKIHYQAYPTKSSRSVYVCIHKSQKKFQSGTAAAKWLIKRSKARDIHSTRRDIYNCCKKNSKNHKVHKTFGFKFSYRPIRHTNENIQLNLF